MRLLDHLRHTVASWIAPRRTVVVVNKRRAKKKSPSHSYATRKDYHRRAIETAQTPSDIMAALRDSRVPLTRKDLNRICGVTTSALWLPALIDKGYVRVVPKTWPYEYEAVSTGDGE